MNLIYKFVNFVTDIQPTKINYTLGWHEGADYFSCKIALSQREWWSDTDASLFPSLLIILRQIKDLQYNIGVQLVGAFLLLKIFRGIWVTPGKNVLSFH